MLFFEWGFDVENLETASSRHSYFLKFAVRPLKLTIKPAMIGPRKTEFLM